MMKGHVVEVDGATLLARWKADSVTVDVLAAIHTADAHLWLEGAGGTTGHCSLWWRTTPRFGNEPVGLIGFYSAGSDGDGQALLEAACDTLTRTGCRCAIGPVDGSTWRNYRLVTERSLPGAPTRPPFFLEPDTPPTWPHHFMAAGFQPIASYTSALCALSSSQLVPRRHKIQDRFAEMGIHVRTLDTSCLDAELAAIHRLSLSAFQKNTLFTPLSFEAFRDLYRPLEKAIQPDLVLLAEDGDRLVGFLFAVPDVLQVRRGEAIDTLVIKTLAVHPAYQGKGIGRQLVSLCQMRAAEKGYRWAVHALMHESNVSQKISRRWAAPFRRYALFGRRLS